MSNLQIVLIPAKEYKKEKWSRELVKGKGRVTLAGRVRASLWEERTDEPDS